MFGRILECGQLARASRFALLTVSLIFRRAMTILLQFGGRVRRKQNDAVLPGWVISASLNFISKDEGVFREMGYSIGDGCRKNSSEHRAITVSHARTPCQGVYVATKSQFWAGQASARLLGFDQSANGHHSCDEHGL